MEERLIEGKCCYREKNSVREIYDYSTHVPQHMAATAFGLREYRYASLNDGDTF